mmetsp:Transcript_21255/g.72392  ORF Transcript_21255/g.72392 Transcript_21255/m.72392 type:complete len:216 (+) Transcript_21255:1447-2094(+)
MLPRQLRVGAASAGCGGGGRPPVPGHDRPSPGGGLRRDARSCAGRRQRSRGCRAGLAACIPAAFPRALRLLPTRSGRCGAPCAPAAAVSAPGTRKAARQGDCRESRPLPQAAARPQLPGDACRMTRPRPLLLTRKLRRRAQVHHAGEVQQPQHICVESPVVVRALPRAYRIGPHGKLLREVGEAEYVHRLAHLHREEHGVYPGVEVGRAHVVADA